MMLQLLLCPPEGGRGSIWARLFAAVGRFFSGEGTEPSAEERNRRAEQLLDRYGQSVLRLSYAYLHNMSDAEEILQDTLVQFLKTSPSLKAQTMKRRGCCGWPPIYAKTD